jgi:hypothetical protein
VPPKEKKKQRRVVEAASAKVGAENMKAEKEHEQETDGR